MIENQRGKNHNGVDIIGECVPRTWQKGDRRRKHEARREEHNLRGKPQRLHNLNDAHHADRRHRQIERQRKQIVERYNGNDEQDQDGSGDHP